MIDSALGLAVGPLPSSVGLVALRAIGFNDIVNVCGAPSSAIWPATVTQAMRLHDFHFRDAFQAVDCLSPASLDPCEFDAFRDAVDTVASALAEGRRCGVFCHLGVSRSPLVAAAALIRARGLPRDEAIGAVRRLRREAVFTPASLAALDRLCVRPVRLGSTP